MLYPSVIQIETSAVCNAHCSFCSYVKGTNVMSEKLFLKIIEEIASWNIPVRILPFLTNEPFADPRMLSFVRLIANKIPNVKIQFYTNASLLMPSLSAALGSIHAVDHITCSLHYLDENVYRTQLGLNLQKTIANIKAALNLSFKVELLRVSDGDFVADSRFVQACNELFPTLLCIVSGRWNWKGDLVSYLMPELDAFCGRLNHMTILHTGIVSLCCMDQLGQYALGDVNVQSLLEIYNGEKHLSYMSNIRRYNNPCKKCNMRG